MSEEMEDGEIMVRKNSGFLAYSLEYALPLEPPSGTPINYRVWITKRTLLRVPAQMPIKPIGGPTSGI